eukprot:GHVS01072226.1.p1 GENE.GHVS01072226.1~~GHVS01072226.1.p1  ORF type:complete len:261 (-),score=33.17 GHVS01072226.1:339-1121(-)
MCRVSCYFCDSVQKLLQCAECGRIKCTSAGGECLVKHAARHATGLALLGAICDFCEAPVCHSRKCVQTHACNCLLRDKEEVVCCVECDRSIWEHGGRAFRCATCNQWLCEDDQFEHQASCQVLDAESYKCMSCNRLGLYSCLRCKVCYCADHVRGHTKVKRGEPIPCKKCGYEVQETKDLSMSVRRHEYGRKRADGDSPEYYRSYENGVLDYDDNEDEMYRLARRMDGNDESSSEETDSDDEEDETSSEEDDEKKKTEVS